MNLQLKPDTPIKDVVWWIAITTCAWFEMSPAELADKKVTIVSPGLLTTGESYEVFLAALASVDLTLEPDGKYQRVVQAKEDRVDRPQGHFPKVSLE